MTRYFRRVGGFKPGHRRGLAVAFVEYKDGKLWSVWSRTHREPFDGWLITINSIEYSIAVGQWEELTAKQVEVILSSPARVSHEKRACAA